MFGVVADEKLKLLLNLNSGSKLFVYPFIITVLAVPCSPITVKKITNCKQKIT